MGIHLVFFYNYFFDIWHDNGTGTHYNRIHNYVNFIHKRIYLFFYFYATNLRKCRYLVLVIIRGKFGINLPSSLLKFWNLSSVTRDISKCQKFNEVIFPQISRINMWFLVNHMWKALKEHTRVRITQKTTNQYQQI